MNALELTQVTRTLLAQVTHGPAEGLFLLLTPLSETGEIWDLEFSAPITISGQVFDEPFDVRVNLQVDRDFLASYEIEPVSGATRAQIAALFPRVTRFVDVRG